MNGLWFVLCGFLLCSVVFGLMWEHAAAPHDEPCLPVPPHQTPAWTIAAEPLERARLEQLDLWPYDQAVDAGVEYAERYANGEALG